MPPQSFVAPGERDTLRTLLRYLGLAAIALCLLIYGVALDGPFLLDDGNQLLRSQDFVNASKSCSELSLFTAGGHSGPLGRPVSMLSFGLNFCLHGMDAWGFKLVNLGLHVLIGLLVFGIGREVMQSPTFADRITPAAAFRWSAFAASVWLLMPLHVSTVLYVIQRMTQLSALFVLLGIFSYLLGRRWLQGEHRLRGVIALASVYVLWLPLATFSKENGLLLVPLCGVIELVCFRMRTAPGWPRTLVRGIVLTTLAVPLLLAMLSLPWTWAWLTRVYAIRDFTLEQRLLTEAMVLLWYAWMSFVPQLNQMGLFLDDFPLSPGLLADPLGAVVLCGWIVLTLYLLLRSARHPILAFALLWFLCGHAMESTILPLEIIFEHRNYLPSMGLLIGVGMLLAANESQVFAARLAVPTLLLWLTVVAGAAGLRATLWADALELHAYEYRHHPKSMRAAIGLGGLHHDAYRAVGNPVLAAQAEGYLREAHAIAPLQQAPLLALLMVQSESCQNTEPLMQELHQALSTQRIHPTTSGLIGDIMGSYLNGSSSLGPEEIAGLAGDVLANPQTLPSTRFDLGIRLANFYINTLRDFTAALRVIDELEQDSNDPFLVEMVRFRIHQVAADPDLKRRTVAIKAMAEAPYWFWERERRRALVRNALQASSGS